MRYNNVLILVSALVLSCCLNDRNVCAQWSRQQGEDWPRMLGQNYDSRSNETGIITEWPKSGLPIVWTAPTGVGYGNGVAADGRWFQFDRFSDRERLTCHKAETGEVLWKWDSSVSYRDPYGYNNGPRCSPVVDDGKVYVFGVTGTLACIDAVSGRELWKIDTTNEYHVVPNFFGVGASPLIYKDKLIVMIGGGIPRKKGEPAFTVNDLPSARPNQCAMVAFDKKTGKELYRTGNYLASYSAPVITKINGNGVCLALVREGLFQFNPDDGLNPQFFPWRASILESVNAASPTAKGDRILISETYEIGSAIVASTPNGFKEIWRDGNGRRNQLLRSHWSTPLLVGDLVFASSGRNEPDTDFRCLSWDQNDQLTLKWTNRNRDRTTGLIVDNHLVLLGERGLLQLISINDGKLDVKSQIDLTATNDPKDGKPLITPPSWAPPVLSHGLLYVRGSDRVICMELIPK